MAAVHWRNPLGLQLGSMHCARSQFQVPWSPRDQVHNPSTKRQRMPAKRQCGRFFGCRCI